MHNLVDLPFLDTSFIFSLWDFYSPPRGTFSSIHSSADFYLNLRFIAHQFIRSAQSSYLDFVPLLAHHSIRPSEGLQYLSLWGIFTSSGHRINSLWSIQSIIVAILRPHGLVLYPLLRGLSNLVHRKLSLNPANLFWCLLWQVLYPPLWGLLKHEHHIEGIIPLALFVTYHLSTRSSVSEVWHSVLRILHEPNGLIFLLIPYLLGMKSLHRSLTGLSLG